MPILKVQLSHNGSQKKFKIETGYRRVGNDIIREWNNDANHYQEWEKKLEFAVGYFIVYLTPV